MHGNLFKFISLYSNWILANYQAIARLNAAVPALRLISATPNKAGTMCFKVQIVGKNVFPVISAGEIIEPRILINFSQEDQIRIRHYLVHNNKYRKRITAKTYNKILKKFVYTVEFFDYQSQKQKNLIVENMSSLLRDIDQFDEEDANFIYSAAQNSLEKII